MQLMFHVFLYLVSLPIPFFPCGGTRRAAGADRRCIWRRQGTLKSEERRRWLPYNWKKQLAGEEQRNRIQREKDR